MEMEWEVWRFLICISILVVFFLVIENFDGYFAWPDIDFTFIPTIISFPLGIQQQWIFF